jgi:hypothetical protein
MTACSWLPGEWPFFNEDSQYIENKKKLVCSFEHAIQHCEDWQRWFLGSRGMMSHFDSTLRERPGSK